MMSAAARLPRDVAALLARSGATALGNARTAAETVAQSVAERSELMRLLRGEAEEDVLSGDGLLRQLSADECFELLATRSVGRLAYIARQGVPDIAPVNYTVVDGTVLIRSGPGPKLQAAERRERVAFEVDELGNGDHSGWSVVVHGTAARVPESTRAHIGAEPQPWAAGPRRHVIRITPVRISGRRLAAPSAEELAP